jgi:hypothetical protein
MMTKQDKKWTEWGEVLTALRKNWELLSDWERGLVEKFEREGESSSLKEIQAMCEIYIERVIEEVPSSDR